jgi:beta-xylosidase
MLRRSRLLPLLVSLVAALVAALLSPAPASAYPGAPWFEPSRTYTANFPDPSLLRDGSAYYAYGTSTGGAYLPVLRSTDLRTWTARPKYDPGYPLNKDPYFNDALPYPASWGVDRAVGGRMKKEIWAPGVAKIGGRYVAFYTIRVRMSPARYCISLATSSSPLGPFVDRTTRPFVCDSDPAGSIDPAPYVDPLTGKAYLVWKSEGVVGAMPTRLWSRQLNTSGTGWAYGSTRRELLRTALRWEGNVIENPSMVRYAGSYWLFYSANEWRSGHYRVGIAKCSSPLGPCRRSRTTPLLANTSAQLGRAGGSAIVDAGGRLRLAYQYWNAPYTNYPAYSTCSRAGTCTTQGQRRMAVVPMRVSATGHLAVG